ncbi:hypothetical protein SAMN05444349_1612 [Bacteroides faecichinchillae]|uniref:Uncharacterized protein n=1 Tax=Bacteroides faecichinchillae TaxID=871325 RepID=A0A1M5GEU3_9BACE|nr:hypothetical protein SAMN05444349_1612 [Bacteroides faecichinchillae]
MFLSARKRISSLHVLFFSVLWIFIMSILIDKIYLTLSNQNDKNGSIIRISGEYFTQCKK